LGQSERGFEINLNKMKDGEQKRLLQQLDLDKNQFLDGPEMKQAMKELYGLHFERGQMTPDIFDAIYEATVAPTQPALPAALLTSFFPFPAPGKCREWPGSIQGHLNVNRCGPDARVGCDALCGEPRI
jgi:hypothetical protein